MSLSRHPPERLRVIVASAAGVFIAVATAFVAPWQLAVLTGWNASAITLLAWIWSSIAPLTADEARAVATRQDNSRAASLLLLTVASSISLVVVLLAFVEAERSEGAMQVLLNVSGVVGVLLSWTPVRKGFIPDTIDVLDGLQTAVDAKALTKEVPSRISRLRLGVSIRTPKRSR